MNHEERSQKFDGLARSYGDDLYRFAVWLCRNPALAADLVQETYLRAWKALDRLQDEDAAKSWLITILRREFARTFERKVPPIDDIDDVVVAELDEDGPDDRTERDRLRREIARLDAIYREPLALQVVLGCSIAEIAAELDLSQSAVMTRVHRAREQLKERLSTDDQDPKR